MIHDTAKHVPVLLNAALRYLNTCPGHFMIDGTVDGGGHARAIIAKMEGRGKFLGVDLDNSMIQKIKKEIAEELKTGNSKLKAHFLWGNYAALPQILKKNKLGKADGLLLDLGFSSAQLESGRGFSFLRNEPLDMRYGQEIRNEKLKNNNSVTAAEIINFWNGKELEDLFSVYGEERYSRRIAKEIVRSRKRKRIVTTMELIAVINNAVPSNYERGRIHPATRVFQSLRIAVNAELGNLERFLIHVQEIMEHKGRIVIISFHSLEDRLVKRRFKELARTGLARLLTPKPVGASAEELEENPQSRSAKLRAVELN